MLGISSSLLYSALTCQRREKRCSATRFLADTVPSPTTAASERSNTAVAARVIRGCYDYTVLRAYRAWRGVDTAVASPGWAVARVSAETAYEVHGWPRPLGHGTHDSILSYMWLDGHARVRNIHLASTSFVTLAARPTNGSTRDTWLVGTCGWKARHGRQLDPTVLHTHTLDSVSWFTKDLMCHQHDSQCSASAFWSLMNRIMRCTHAAVQIELHRN